MRPTFPLPLARSLAITFFGFLLVSIARAQVSSVNDVTAPPTPGVGHDYIKMFGETVNPGNGSVSLRIDLPLPKGRVLNVPFAILYSSSGVHHLEAHGPGNGVQFVTETGQTTGSGWSYSVPSLTAIYGVKSYTAPGPPPTTYTCNYVSNYIMRDWTGTMHPLGISIAQGPGAGNDGCYNVPGPPINYLSGSGDFFQAVADAPCAGCDVNGVSTNVTVAGPNGTVYRFPASVCFYNASGFCSFFTTGSGEDRNGNRVGVGISMGVGTHSGDGTFGSITDTLGRTAVNISKIVSNANTISVSGLSTPYTQHWTSVSSNFSVGATFSGNNSADR